MVDKSLEIDLNPMIDSPTTGNRNVPTNGGGIINRILSFPLVHYVFSQPPIFTFLVSMLFLSFCLLPLGGYVSNNELPDFDLMMKWNAPLGNLPSYKFCPGGNESTLTTAPPPCVLGACVAVEFTVPSSIIEEYCNRTLIRLLQGKVLASRDDKHKLIRNDIYIYVQLPLTWSNTNNCSRAVTQVQAFITYCPINTSKLDLSAAAFKEDRNKSNSNGNGPCTYTRKDWPITFVNMSTDCSDPVITPVQIFKHRGIVNFFLTPDQRQVSAGRLYIASLIVFLLTVLFGVTVCLIDRPKTKSHNTTSNPSTEK